MKIADLLDLLDESLEGAFVVPLTGRRVVNADKVRELIDEIRANFPIELKKARDITQHRDQILDLATQKADEIIRVAENRVRKMMNEEDVVKKAQQYARELTSAAERKADSMISSANKKAESNVEIAQTQSTEMRNSAFKLSENMLKQSEEVLGKSYSEIKRIRGFLLEKVDQP